MIVDLTQTLRELLDDRVSLAERLVGQAGTEEFQAVTQVFGADAKRV
jgi:hypothetical protein